MPPKSKKFWKWSRRRAASSNPTTDSLSPPVIASDLELAKELQAEADADTARRLLQDEEDAALAAALAASDPRMPSADDDRAAAATAVTDVPGLDLYASEDDSDDDDDSSPGKMPAVAVAAAAGPAPASRPMILSEMGFMIPAPPQYPNNIISTAAATARRSSNGSNSGSESDNSDQMTSPLYYDDNNQISVSNLKTEEDTSARDASSHDHHLAGTIFEDFPMNDGDHQLRLRDLPNSAGTSGRGKKHRPSSGGSKSVASIASSGAGSVISIVSSGIASVKSSVESIISISSSSTAASVKCALPSLFDSKKKKEREDFLQLVADLQAISDYGIAHAKNLKYEAAKVIPITHGKNVIPVLIFESDKQLLLQAIQNDVDFCRYVKDLRGSPDEHKLHSLRIENDIYFELAQLLAPTDVKMFWRIEIILKCPKDEELANGENIETGGANDEVARNQCASVVAETDIDNNFAFSPIKRGSGTTGSYTNARGKCIKDTGPGKCGCKDWQDDEVERAKHYLETKAHYFRSKKIPVAAICFGGTSAKKVMVALDRSLFDAINCDAHPHLCTLVCAYGYKNYSLQLQTIYGKVGSISSTLDVFWGIVESRYPSFERPTKTMLDALVASKELPMVNEDTPANVEAARKANKKRISKLMKRLWQDENWRKRTLAARWGKKRKKKLKKVFNANWKNPEWVAKWKAARWSDAQRAEHSDLMKSLFQKPEWVAKWKAARWSDAQRAEHSEKMKKIAPEWSAMMKAGGHTSTGGQKRKEDIDKEFNRESNRTFVCLKCAKGGVLSTQKFPVGEMHTTGIQTGRPKVGQGGGKGYCQGCRARHRLWTAVEGDSDEADIDDGKIPSWVQSITSDDMCSEDNCFNFRILRNGNYVGDKCIRHAYG